jgi:hypothetical protein
MRQIHRNWYPAERSRPALKAGSPYVVNAVLSVALLEFACKGHASTEFATCDDIVLLSQAIVGGGSGTAVAQEGDLGVT